jgi:hypothetical protein
MADSSLQSLNTCIPFEEFSGKRVSREEFRKFLSQFKREQAVLAACVAYAFLGSWSGNIDPKGNDALMQVTFPSQFKCSANSPVDSAPGLWETQSSPKRNAYPLGCAQVDWREEYCLVQLYRSLLFFVLQH